MTRLTFVLGTAAELIKIYPVARLARAQGLGVRFVGTGQSRANFLMQYRDFDLDERELEWLMEGSEDLRHSGGALRWFLRALGALVRVRRRTERTEFVLVHGDTLSTLIGALYGRRVGARVVHIEAGLRSASWWHPFPEEVTRRLVSYLVDWHMAPDEVAAQNLRSARVRGTVVNTHGNTLADCVYVTPPKPGLAEKFALVNVHRFENLNSPARWRAINQTLLQAARDLKLIVVLHPQTRHRLDRDPTSKSKLSEAGVELRDRLPFAAFIQLVRDAEYLISDGGSNQEECSYLGKPCLLLRMTTERQEGLGSNCLLSKFDPRLIEDFLNHPAAFVRPPQLPPRSPSFLILDALRGAVL